ncbi:MAG: 3-hydroxyacyl-CoA dehydrogenase family protein [Ginsengibacter sp.]|jgi:3-hydroxybutyryl-CoA dehydrogenase
MQIYINASAEQEEELRSKELSNETNLIFSSQLPISSDSANFDVFFILNHRVHDLKKADLPTKSIFINSVIDTLVELNLPKNVHRINGWPGFLSRNLWEISTQDEEEVKAVFEKIDWQFIIVKDTPGLVAARVISMVINEAYYALKEQVSTPQEIDTAMKLGTNYPFGPFEWAEKIGLKNVHQLLSKLSIKDKRCIPSFEIENN